MSNKNGVWILTSENNDYDQHGEYFRAVFKEKPTVKQLAEWFTNDSTQCQNVMAALAFIEHVLNGGGRQGKEHEWFHLKFIEYGEKQ